MMNGETVVTVTHQNGTVTHASACLDIRFMFEGLDINGAFANVERARRDGKWRGIDALPYPGDELA